MMTSDQVRKAFLDFFREKGHKIIPSSPLIPKGDPTLLLTNAGMVQIKPYFLGEEVPPSPRLASCQKCFRTSDLASVGDAGHLTFFEMLGNFSVGDYFKQEAIAWAWEFVTERLKLEPERLWATIFLDDDESFGYWREVGVPENKILRFGEEDNFWGPAGDSGPCGPCSEIHYDFGEEFGCGRSSCRPNCDCGRFSEIWNLVFTQYDQDREGSRTPLAKPNIDTGMGLERTAAVMQGKSNVYDTDLFVPLIEKIAGLSGRKYGADEASDYAMRVVVEHGRGIAFLIADGVLPGNEGRGYVLRRVLRRTSLFGRRLGLEKPFIDNIAEVTIGLMGHIYPELKKRRDFILQVIEDEETRFGATLSTGLELLDDIVAEAAKTGKKEISGGQAFKLYDTYGFPVELTQEIAADRGFSVDLDNFELEMGKQKERARAARKDVTIEVPTAQMTIEALAPEVVVTSGKLPPRVDFVGYSSLTYKSKIVSLSIHNKPAKEIKEGQEASLLLECTPFYGEMGGQVGDTGQIRGHNGLFEVTDTIQLPPSIIVHQGRVVEGYLSVGDEVEAVVETERRLDIARNHTATHLLQMALRRVLGEHVQQRGSLVAPHRLRFDFSHLKALSAKQIAEVNHIVNEEIRHNLPVYDEVVPYKEAIESGAIALFDEKYGDTVRVLKIGKPFISAELCGGTHVSATGEIGLFHIIGESSIGAGLRRIEAVTGRGAEQYFAERLSDLQKTAEYLGTETDKLVDKASNLVTELKEERRQRLSLEKEVSKNTAKSLVIRGQAVKGIKVIAESVPSSRPEALRELCDLLREQIGSGIIVLGTIYQGKPAFLAAVTPDLVAKGYDAGKIVKQVAAVTGGSGGGKPNLAQAGGKDKKKLDQALNLVKSLI
jgi:alanyl-tRNA synthetase